MVAQRLEKRICDLTLKQVQKQLVKRCKEIVKRCTDRTELITKGHAHAAVESGAVGSTSEISHPTQQGSQATSAYQMSMGPALTEDRQSIIALGQNELIQEWHIYLDDVFSEALRLCLCDREFHDRLPKQLPLQIPDLDWTCKSKMIESACVSQQERFSFIRYHDKISIVERLLGLTFGAGSPEDTAHKNTAYEVDKHVMIRNVCQHSRRQIRATDLRDVGREGRTIYVLDDAGNRCEFGEGQVIVLSLAEIVSLSSEIEKYSLWFRELK